MSCFAPQTKKLPLHYSCNKGTSLQVAEALLEASPEAATKVDEARVAVPTHTLSRATCRRLFPHHRCAANVTPADRGRGRREPTCDACGVAQDGKLPLHYAAENGASLEVVNLLLGSDTGLATKPDQVPC